MTPDERLALADRLDALANQAKQLQVYGISMDVPKRDADLFSEAAAALRDAANRQTFDRGLIHGYTLHVDQLEAERDAALARAEQAEARLEDSWYSDIGARLDAATEEVTRLRKGIEHHRNVHACGCCYVDKVLWALLDDEGTGR